MIRSHDGGRLKHEAGRRERRGRRSFTVASRLVREERSVGGALEVGTLCERGGKEREEG